MTRHSLVQDFLADESGAVTVDWVVLTAAICTLGAIVVFTISSGVMTVADASGDSLGTAELAPVGHHGLFD